MKNSKFELIFGENFMDLPLREEEEIEDEHY